MTQILEVGRFKERAGQLVILRVFPEFPEPKAGAIFGRKNSDDEWVIMGIETQGPQIPCTDKFVALLLVPTMKTVERGKPWISMNDEISPKVRIVGRCVFCHAAYSTDDELQKHLDARRYHLLERLAATEKLAEDVVKNVEKLLQTSKIVASLQPASRAEDDDEAMKWKDFYDAINEMELR